MNGISDHKRCEKHVLTPNIGYGMVECLVFRRALVRVSLLQ